MRNALSLSRALRQLLVAWVLAGLPLACGTPVEPEPQPIYWDSAKTALVARYDSAFQTLNGGNGCAHHSNDDGTLAWAQSYLLRSLVAMYDGTGEPRYLDDFVTQAELVVASLDIRRGLHDYAGRSAWAWSTLRYNVDEARAFWLVHDAVIAAPLLRFARIVLATPHLGVTYDDAALRYVEVVERVLGKYSQLYRLDPARAQGQYLVEAGFPALFADPDEPRPLPLNHDAAAGEVHALLWQITGNEHHKDRAIQIGRRLASHFLVLDDRYVWHYWGLDGQVLHNTAWEDVSHGAIEVTFATLLAQLGVVFSDVDVHRLSRTLLAQRDGHGFLRRVATDDPDVSTPDAKCGMVWNRRFSDASGRWLNPISAESYRAVEAYFDSRRGPEIDTDPYLMASLAELVKYAGSVRE